MSKKNEKKLPFKLNKYQQKFYDDLLASPDRHKLMIKCGNRGHISPLIYALNKLMGIQPSTIIIDEQDLTEL